MSIYFTGILDNRINHITRSSRNANSFLQITLYTFDRLFQIFEERYEKMFWSNELNVSFTKNSRDSNEFLQIAFYTFYLLFQIFERTP